MRANLITKKLLKRIITLLTLLIVILAAIRVFNNNYTASKEEQLSNVEFEGAFYGDEKVTSNKDNNDIDQEKPNDSILEKVDNNKQKRIFNIDNSIYKYLSFGFNSDYSRVRGIDSKLLAGESNGGISTITLDYFTLTLNKGIGISDVSGNDIYLKAQSPSIDASLMPGYSFNKWIKEEGNDPADPNQKNTTVYLDSKTTLTADGSDAVKPEVSIQKQDYNTINWTATDDIGVTGYQITNTSEVPTEWIDIASTNSFNNSYDIDGTVGKIYYIWES